VQDKYQSLVMHLLVEDIIFDANPKDWNALQSRFQGAALSAWSYMQGRDSPFRDTRPDTAPLKRIGFCIGMTECLAAGVKQIEPTGQAAEILQARFSSPDEKTEALADYLDRHNLVGLGEPVRPYVYLGFERMRDLIARVREEELEANGFHPNDEMQAELYERIIAYG
jgi:hypothetical protein